MRILLSLRRELLSLAIAAGYSVTPFCAVEPIEAQQLAPTIEGQYFCGTQWHRMTLRITEKSNGEVQGDADFGSRLYAISRRVLPGTPAKLKGRIDLSQRVFSFATNDDIRLNHEGPTQKTQFRATIDEQGLLSGTVDYPGCGKFFAASTASPAGRAVVQLVRQEQYRIQTERAAGMVAEAERQREANRESRRASGWIPVELRPQGGRISNSDGMLEYNDAKLAGRALAPGIQPVDEMHQSLFDNRHKCLATSHVTWNGRSGTTRTELFSRKTYVIDCDGNCEGLRYEPIGVVNAFHAGAQAAPVITLIYQLLGKVDVQWNFTRPNDSEPTPDVRIHMWTSAFGDYGGGCRLR